MQLKAIIANAKARFTILLTTDDEITPLLVQSLTAYQEMAGCLRVKLIEQAPDRGEIQLPASFLAHAMCSDADGDFVPVTIIENEDNGTSIAKVSDSELYPLKYEYFVNLAYYADNLENHIPNRISGMIIDHLECLIGANNDERIARVEAGGKMDTSRIPTPLDRDAQRLAIEEKFRANRAIVPMASVHPI